MPIPLGLGQGSYVAGDAMELGLLGLEIAHGLPGLRSGAVPFSARLLNAGEQSLVDTLVDHGGSYLDVTPEPYLKP